MPVDPSFAIDALRGPEWAIPRVETPRSPNPTGFGALLADSVQALNTTQADAAQAAQALATGQASDPVSVVMAVDSSKFGVIAANVTAPVSLPDLLITDADAPEPILRELDLAGLATRIAKPDTNERN